MLLLPLGVVLPGLVVGALAILGLALVVGALRRQAPASVIEAVRPATAGE